MKTEKDIEIEKLKAENDFLWSMLDTVYCFASGQPKKINDSDILEEILVMITVLSKKEYNQERLYFNGCGLGEFIEEKKQKLLK